jgi:hypothetical protein
MSTAFNTAGNLMTEFETSEETADIKLAIDLLNSDVPRK